MKKLFVFLLVLSLASGLFAAGRQQSTSGADPYANAPKEFSMTVLDRGQVPASEGTYADNRWVRWINENSPVKVTFVPVPRNGSRDAITALFAAGMAPDIIWEYNKITMDMYYDQGVIQPVDEYIEKYSTAFKEYQAQNPDLMPYLIAPDGRQYGLTSRRHIGNRVNQSLFVRKDWLDRFGMAAPVTTDDALAFMRRARDENPSGLGTWGVGTDYSWDIVCNAIFGKPAGDFNVVNGHFVDWFSTPAYRDALAWRAQIYQEGLIDPEYITDGPNFTRQRQFLVTGRIAMRFQGMGFQGDYFDFINNVPNADFVPIAPLRSPYGQFGFGLEVPFLKMVCMNKDAKNPKAIMEFLDWQITDGYWTLSYGLEGRHYQMVNGVPQVIDAALNRIEVDYIKGNYEFALVDNNASKFTTDWIPIQSAQDPISQDWARRYAQAVAYSQDIPYLEYVPYSPTSPAIEAFNTATSGLTTQVYALETAIMIGRISVDEGLRQINEYKRSMGWDAVNAEKDAWYQANKHLFSY